MIWEYSKGIPRNINTLCDNALQTAYLLGEESIKASVVEKVITGSYWGLSSSSARGQTTLPLAKFGAWLTGTIFQPRFTSIASLIFIVSISMVAAFLAVHYHLRARTSNLLSTHTTASVAGPSHSSASDESGIPWLRATHRRAPTTPPVVSEDKGESRMGTVRHDIHAHEKAGAVLLEIKKGEPLVETNAAMSSTNEAHDTNERQLTFQDKGKRPFGRGTSAQQQPGEKGTSPAGLVPHFNKKGPEVKNVVIQVGAFREKPTAVSLVKSLEGQGYDVFLEKQVVERLGLVHRVRLHGYRNISAARKELPFLRNQGFTDAFVLSLRQ